LAWAAASDWRKLSSITVAAATSSAEAPLFFMALIWDCCFVTAALIPSTSRPEDALGAAARGAFGAKVGDATAFAAEAAPGGGAPSWMTLNLAVLLRCMASEGMF